MEELSTNNNGNREGDKNPRRGRNLMEVSSNMGLKMGFFLNKESSSGRKEIKDSLPVGLGTNNGLNDVLGSQ